MALIKIRKLQKTKITPLAFDNRFKPQEISEFLASGNPATKMFMRKQEMAKYIDLTDPNTIAGVNALVQDENCPTFTQERADIVLNAPPTAGELI